MRMISSILWWAFLLSFADEAMPNTSEQVVALVAGFDGAKKLLIMCSSIGNVIPSL